MASCHQAIRKLSAWSGLVGGKHLSIGSSVLLIVVGLGCCELLPWPHAVIGASCGYNAAVNY